VLPTVAVGKVERAQSFTLPQQATIEIMRCNHYIIACSCHLYMGTILHAHPVRGESLAQRNAIGEVATLQIHTCLIIKPAFMQQIIID